MLGKHGVPSDECMELVHYIKEDCVHLSFDGLMTIGRMNHHPDVSGPNPNFVVMMYVWCMWCNSLSVKGLDFINIILLPLCSPWLSVARKFSLFFSSQAELN